MSFFQNKPAAFGTPQSTNTNTNAFSSSFSTPAAPKPGPFSVGGFGLNTSQSGTGAFGSSTNTGTGTFGGFGANTNQQNTGGFGQGTPQQGSMFGQNAAQQGGGLYGQNVQGSTFGQNTAQQGGFGQSTGGFGVGTGFGQNNPNQGGFGQSINQGGFGLNTGTQGGGTIGGFGQKPGGFGGGVFGQANQQQANQPGFGGGGFFNTQQQQQQPQPTFGGSTFGGSTVGGASWLQPQPQQQTQVYQQQPQITPITRWSDLPPQDQKVLEELEKYITEQKAICEDLKTRSPQLEEYVLSIPTDVAEVQKRFDTISHILAVDTTVVAGDLKEKFDLLSTQTQQTVRLLEVLIHPSAASLSYLASTHGAGGDSLIDLFLQKTVEWQAKLDSFKREIAEIDRMLKAVEEGQMSGASSASEEILETIRAQWDGFCGLAARVGKLKERAAEVKIIVERGLRGGRL